MSAFGPASNRVPMAAERVRLPSGWSMDVSAVLTPDLVAIGPFDAQTPPARTVPSLKATSSGAVPGTARWFSKNQFFS